MDTAVLVALLGLVGVVVSSMIGLVVAVITHRSEKTESAGNSLEKTLRERITLQLERIEILTQQRDDARNELTECRSELRSRERGGRHDRL